MSATERFRIGRDARDQQYVIKEAPGWRIAHRCATIAEASAWLKAQGVDTSTIFVVCGTWPWKTVDKTLAGVNATVEKIKKLLRLGKSSNQHEAELALQRAFEIAEKNHIDLASLDVGDDLKKIARHAHRCGWRLSYPRKVALGVVATFFNVTPVVGYPCIDFVGTASDVEIAIYVFEFLVRACNKALRASSAQYRRRKISRNAMVNFCHGFFYGVTQNLKRSRAEVLAAHDQYALVIQSEEQRRDQFIADTMTTKPVKLLEEGRRNPDALTLGHRAGLEVQINKPLPTVDRFQLCAVTA